MRFNSATSPISDVATVAEASPASSAQTIRTGGSVTLHTRPADWPGLVSVAYGVAEVVAKPRLQNV